MNSARINDVALLAADETADAATLRQRACTELLRQEAIAQGLLPATDPLPEGGVLSETASAAIEQLIDRELELPDPAEDECRRHFNANPARYATGERVMARHILFAVQEGVDVNRLRQRAEACLVDVRGQTPEERANGDGFAHAASTLSNCPSGAEGGNLGWLSSEDCAPEFARELFGSAERGVLPRLVHSRFGLHVVEIQAREPGQQHSFEQVSQAVRQHMRQQSFATALTQYLQILAGRADVVGVELAASSTPLVQ